MLTIILFKMFLQYLKNCEMPVNRSSISLPCHSLY